MFDPLLCNQTGLKFFKSKGNFEPQQLHCRHTCTSGISESSGITLVLNIILSPQNFLSWGFDIMESNDLIC